MRHKAKNQKLRKYYYLIGFCFFLILALELVKPQTPLVEYYAQKIYPAISYIAIVLFSWIPFSFGDCFYVIVFGLLIFNLLQLIKFSFGRNLNQVKIRLTYITSIISVMYVLFYVNWGLNYFRQPLAEKLGLNAYTISREDYLAILDKYIDKANELRKELDITSKTKNGVKGDIAEIIFQDTLLQDYLCKTQVHVKAPLSSEIASYFTVSGYFNPFTLEAHVNQNIPNASYPFTTVHELAHQMGVGFEDECNFIAFLTLYDDADVWYQYSAYYSAIGYLMQPLSGNKELFEKYRAKLSAKVLDDFRKEREFWQSYRGWIDRVSAVFYNQFLKHNNQPEGLDRYNQMATLLVAWEMQQKKLP